VNTHTKIIYEIYIASPQWEVRRQRARQLAANACQICKSTELLEVHHNSYEHLGNEFDHELVVLCHKCHLIHHENSCNYDGKRVFDPNEESPF
jgi:hypothetical protein